MVEKIIRFPTATRTKSAPEPSSAPKAASGQRTRPTTSLALLLRSAPPALQPAQIAADLLALGSNAAAAPIWAGRKASFLKLISARRLSVADRHRLAEQWRAAVRTEGIQQKAQRRAARLAAERDFSTLFENDAPHRA